jgi:hypothetical protein
MDKPVLHVESETIHRVEHNELEKFIEDVTGHSFDIISCEECNNPWQRRYDVTGKLSEYEQKEWNLFKDIGKPNLFMLRTILNGLAAEGHIPKQIYLVTVSW